MSTWVSAQNLVNLSQKVAELFYSLAAPVLRVIFVQYIIAFCSLLEAMSDVISGTYVGALVPNNCVKFGDRRLNRS